MLFSVGDRGPTVGGLFAKKEGPLGILLVSIVLANRALLFFKVLRAKQSDKDRTQKKING